MKTWKLSVAALIVSMLAGMAMAANPVAVTSTSSLTPAETAICTGVCYCPRPMPCLSCLVPCDGICALLLQTNALLKLPCALRRHLCALLLQADALFLHSHRAARLLRAACKVAGAGHGAEHGWHRYCLQTS